MAEAVLSFASILYIFLLNAVNQKKNEPLPKSQSKLSMRLKQNSDNKTEVPLCGFQIHGRFYKSLYMLTVRLGYRFSEHYHIYWAIRQGSLL